MVACPKFGHHVQSSELQDYELLHNLQLFQRCYEKKIPFEHNFNTNNTFTIFEKSFCPCNFFNLTGKCPNFGQGVPNLGHITLVSYLFIRSLIYLVHLSEIQRGQRRSLEIVQNYVVIIIYNYFAGKLQNLKKKNRILPIFLYCL